MIYIKETESSREYCTTNATDVVVRDAYGAIIVNATEVWLHLVFSLSWFNLARLVPCADLDTGLREVIKKILARIFGTRWSEWGDRSGWGSVLLTLHVTPDYIHPHHLIPGHGGSSAARHLHPVHVNVFVSVTDFHQITAQFDRQLKRCGNEHVRCATTFKCHSCIASSDRDNIPGNAISFHVTHCLDCCH